MSSVDSSVYKLKVYDINLLIHERCVYKKLLEILGNCCVIVRHALHFHSHSNHILICSLNIKIEAPLYITVDNRFHIF